MRINLDIANTLSACGTLLSLLGYYYLTIHSRERLSLSLDFAGALLLTLSFYFFGSNSFIVLNATWAAISLYGLFKRKRGSVGKIDKHWSTNLLLGAITAAAVITTMAGKLEIASWLVIGIFLGSFAYFSARRLTRIEYILYGLVGAGLSIPYLIDLGNYPSALYQTLSALLAVGALRNHLNLKKRNN